MPGPINLSFEIAGPTPGSALGWTRTSQSSVEDLGVRDGFEVGWLNTGYSQHIATASLGPVDGVASGWLACEAWSPSIAALEAAAHAGGSPVERFEGNWLSNQLWSPTIVSLTAGAVESFSTGWKSNQSYAANIGTKASAAIETFSSVLLDQPFEVLGAPTATMTAPGHVLTNGKVVFAQTTSSLPTGLGKLVKYFIVNAVAGVSFELSLTSGGAAIAVTDSGVGDHNTTGDPSLYWTVSID